MPVDPRIALGVEPMRIDLLGSYLKAQQIRQQEAARQADQEERAAARDERRENRTFRLGEIANQGRLRDIIAAPGEMTEERLNAVMALDPETGMRLRAHFATLSKAKRDEAMDKAEQMARSVGAIEALPIPARQAAYAQLRASKGGIDTSAMPETYSPEWSRMTMFNALTIKEQLALLEPKDPTTEPLEEVDEGGKPIYRPRSQAIGKQKWVAPASAAGSEPLETVDENGVPTFRPRSQAVGKTAYRAPTATSGDDPTLPQGVKDYLFSMQQKVVTDANNRAVIDANGQKVPYRVQDALADLAAVMPKLKRDHPKLDPLKAQKAVKDLFGEDTSGAFLPSDDPKVLLPVPPTTMKTSPQSGAAGGKSVTAAELGKIAARRGTTVEQERARARAAGYTVR